MATSSYRRSPTASSRASAVPPDAPISFTGGGADACSSVSTVITGFDCFKFTKRGKRIDKTESCVVSVAGDTITIDDVGGVGDHISWKIAVTDVNGNSSEGTCEVIVVNPGNP